MARPSKSVFELLHRAPVGRTNQYGLGRFVNPPLGVPFVAPPRTPCIDPDYDQATEARLRSEHKKKFDSYFQELQAVEVVQKPERDPFKAYRDEYHNYHHPFRNSFSHNQGRQLHTSARKPSVKEAIIQHEQRRPFTQLFRRRQATIVEQDPKMLELMEHIIQLEKGLRVSCRNIILMRNELMVLEYSCQYARYKI